MDSLRRLVCFISLVLLTAAAPAAPSQAGQSAKLAVVGQQAELQTINDLLTAELSGNDRLQLLERSQIERVQREQNLSAAQQGNFLRLGQVLGADGLLILEIRKRSQTNALLVVRLVAVKPGVALAEYDCQWPLAETVSWTKWMGRQLTPYIPKLKVLPQDAVPVSILQVRSAIHSVQAMEADNDMTSLLIRRLIQEPSIFVLERRRLELSQEEKDQQGLGHENFWTGQYLVEGMIDSQGYDPERMTIAGRIKTPRGGAVLQFDVSGPRTNRAAVVETMVQSILQRINVKGTSELLVTGVDEARKYFEEAQWAWKWGNVAAAQQSVEAAWALGGQNYETAKLRIQAALAQIRMECMPPPGIPLYVGRFPFAMAQVLLAKKACSIYLEAEQMGVVNQVPIELRAGKLLPLLEWKLQGSEVLVNVAEVLKIAHFDTNSFSQAESLADLRGLAREVLRLVDGLAATETRHWNLVCSNSIYWRKNNVPLYTNNLPAFIVARELERREQQLQSDYNRAKQSELEKLKEMPHSKPWSRYYFINGAAFCDTPEEEVELYRKFLREGCFTRYRAETLNRDWTEPLMFDWTTAGRTRSVPAWTGFVNEVCRSTNLQWQMEGLILKARLGESIETAITVGKEMLPILKATWPAVTNNQDLLGVWTQSRDLISRRLLWQGGIRGRPIGQEIQAIGVQEQAPQGPPPVGFAPPASTSRTPMIPPVTVAPPAAESPARQKSVGASNVMTLTLKNFWKPENTMQPRERISETNIAVRAIEYRAGRLLAEVEVSLDMDYRYSATLRSWHEKYICQIDPETLVVERVGMSSPVLRTNIIGLPFGLDKNTGLTSFEVVGDNLFHLRNSKLMVCNFIDKKWRELPMEIPVDASLSGVDGRLFVISPNALMEYDVQTGKSILLASNRRTVPEGPLDLAGSLNNHVFKGPDGQISTMLGNRLYALDSSSNTWVLRSTFDGLLRSARVVRLSKGFAALGYESVVDSPLWLNANEPVLAIFGITPESRGAYPIASRFPCLWLFPSRRTNPYTFDFDGKQMYILRGYSEGSITLVHFSTEYEEPVFLNLDLVEKPQRLRMGSAENQPSKVLILRDHLLVAIPLYRGFWLVPKNSLAETIGFARQVNPPTVRTNKVQPFSTPGSPTSRVSPGFPSPRSTAGAKGVFISSREFDLNKDGILDENEMKAFRAKRDALMSGRTNKVDSPRYR